MGPETDNGHWLSLYQVQFPYSIAGQQYFYGQDMEARKWFIELLLPGGKMGKELQNGTWAGAYQVQFPFALGGQQYFHGQSLTKLNWFIQTLNG